MQYDIAIVGGSNAGLAAALSAGRSNRKTIVLDAGSPRNKPATYSHNFFTRDGESPASLIAIAKEQLKAYPVVELRSAMVTQAIPHPSYFELVTADGGTIIARKIIFATGVTDTLPAIEGVQDLWGKKLINCPYCHGWEFLNQPIAIIAPGAIAYTMAITISNWNKDITFLLNGDTMEADEQRKLEAKGWAVIQTPVTAITDHEEGIVIQLADGTALQKAAAYIKPEKVQFNHQLALQLGCSIDENGCIITDDTLQTTIPGVYAAGDILYPGLHYIAGAAANGHKAAMFCNNQLCREDF